jgi:hypothetical protein
MVDRTKEWKDLHRIDPSFFLREIRKSFRALRDQEWFRCCLECGGPNVVEIGRA